ncbi:hypothetical protein QFX18_09975 [Saccharophagus degradans]|uniref:hypothetical protein n=1 Tax=Saccharophagus degradans TaxID=86304 RepID=UPI0024780AF2|nr:hypothetical protein [Saccharophagus degradans]WGP00374.1 hypothetical protein QFX18_09975 [Saccharophagus degradans]
MRRILKFLVLLASRQPFIFVIGLCRRSLIRSNYFDVRVLLNTSRIKTEVGSKVFYPSRIGRYCFIGVDSCVFPNVEIETYCSIGNGCLIGTGEHEYTSLVLSSRISSMQNVLAKPLLVESDVWCGNGCLVKGGIVVGRGSVLGMGAVVLASVERYSIAAGVPAKKLNSRFSADVSEKLESTEWWLLSPREATRVLGEVSPNPDGGAYCD